MTERPIPEHRLATESMASFDLVLSVRSPLHYSDEVEYVSTIEGSIVRSQLLPSEQVERQEVVGSIRALRIYGGRALDEGESLWDACDAHCQTAADVYAVVFSGGYEFREDIEATFPNASSPDLLVVDLIRLAPHARGCGIGLRAVRRLIDLFEPDGGLIVIKPFPLQFNVQRREHEDQDLRMFTCGEAAAFAKLRNYWQRLGFRQIPNSEYYGLSPALVTPTVRDLESQYDSSTLEEGSGES